MVLFRCIYLKNHLVFSKNRMYSNDIIVRHLMQFLLGVLHLLCAGGLEMKSSFSSDTVTSMPFMAVWRSPENSFFTILYPRRKFAYV